MNLKFRNRIAFFFIASTALLTALLFIIIFSVMRNSIYSHLDDKLNTEFNEVIKGLYIGNDTLSIINVFEWDEREHGQIEVNPIYLEILTKDGILIRKSENLYDSHLEFLPIQAEKSYFNSLLNQKQIRQIQVPLKSNNGKISGFMMIGLPLDEQLYFLNQLEIILLSGFVAALIILFLIARWIAGKSILPIHNVIATSERITKEYLGERIELPKNKDEIYELTATVNGLLDRLEDAVLREKQFTADASHELRTPLSVIKGTLEVLIRKPRDVEQYQNKISYCIHEVNRMTTIIDQLLMLARYESEKIEPHAAEIELNESIKYSILRIEPFAERKDIKICFSDNKKYFVIADPFMLNVIIENLLSNAIKYSNGNNRVDIFIDDSAKFITCRIKDYGIGMTKDEISRIFNRFYRGDKARGKAHSGDGIGLAIVKRLADLQNITITFTSEPDKGTTANITFPV